MRCFYPWRFSFITISAYFKFPLIPLTWQHCPVPLSPLHILRRWRFQRHCSGWASAQRGLITYCLNKSYIQRSDRHALPTASGSLAMTRQIILKPSAPCNLETFCFLDCCNFFVWHIFLESIRIHTLFIFQGTYLEIIFIVNDEFRVNCFSSKDAASALRSHSLI